MKRVSLPQYAEESRWLGRRDLIRAGVASAASLVLTEACGGAEVEHDAGSDHHAPPMRSFGTLVDGGGSCVQTSFTRPVAIATAGIALQGTSTEITDSRYVDPVCKNHDILLVHPTTKDVYVAMSGSCTHLCCSGNRFGGPAYHATLHSQGETLTDVVECACHGSIYDALTGSVLRGPSVHPLEVLKTCVGGGYVFVEIPER